MSSLTDRLGIPSGFQPLTRRIEIGTAVRVSLAGGWAERDMTEEGLVIEVVPAGCCPHAARVRPARSSRSSVTRYVIQCDDCRVLRRAYEMRVVSL